MRNLTPGQRLRIDAHRLPRRVRNTAPARGWVIVEFIAGYRRGEYTAPGGWPPPDVIAVHWRATATITGLSLYLGTANVMTEVTT